MKKTPFGWVVAIVFIVAFVALWANISDIKEEYEIEASEDYYNFYSAMNYEIQLMDLILAQEKALLKEAEDPQSIQLASTDLALGLGSLSLVEMPEAEHERFREYHSNIISAISSFQKKAAASEVEKLEKNLAAYKLQFQKWLDRENKCAHLSGFCAGYGTEAYQ